MTAAAAQRHRNAAAESRRRATRPKTPPGRRTARFLTLFLSVTALVMLGVVMGLSATAAPSLSDTNSAWSLFRRHLVLVGMGLFAFVITVRVDYRRWRPFASKGMIAGLVLVAATALPQLGVTANGAQRWISVGPVSFQPSELAKLALIFFIADLLSRPARLSDDLLLTLRPVIAVSVLLVVLLMLQPHLGASLMVAIIAASMLVFAGTRLMPLAGLALVGLAAAAGVVAMSPWRWQRMLGFINPWEDPLGNGYQPLQSLHALATGGIDGVGLGQGRSKWGFLPYAHTDFIFSVIGEELGLLGTMFVTLLFGLIGVAGFLIALRAPDRFGMLLAVGITTGTVSQAVINIGTALAVFPVVGMTLPMLSFGGTSLVTTLAAMGVLLNIARHDR